MLWSRCEKVQKSAARWKAIKWSAECEKRIKAHTRGAKKDKSVRKNYFSLTFRQKSGRGSFVSHMILWTLDNLNGLIVDYQQHIDYRNFISQKNGKYRHRLTWEWVECGVVVKDLDARELEKWNFGIDPRDGCQRWSISEAKPHEINNFQFL